MTDDRQEFIDGMYRQRGYVAGFHKVMVAEDLDWAKAYNPFAAATYTGQRTLPRKTKELLQVVVLAALKADGDHIGEHVRLAVESGASKQEVLEALEVVFLPMGAVAFQRGLEAWAKVVQARRIEPTVASS